MYHALVQVLRRLLGEGPPREGGTEPGERRLALSRRVRNTLAADRQLCGRGRRSIRNL